MKTLTVILSWMCLATGVSSASFAAESANPALVALDHYVHELLTPTFTFSQMDPETRGQYWRRLVEVFGDQAVSWDQFEDRFREIRTKANIPDQFLFRPVGHNRKWIGFLREPEVVVRLVMGDRSVLRIAETSPFHELFLKEGTSEPSNVAEKLGRLETTRFFVIERIGAESDAKGKVVSTFTLSKMKFDSNEKFVRVRWGVQVPSILTSAFFDHWLKWMAGFLKETRDRIYFRLSDFEFVVHHPFVLLSQGSVLTKDGLISGSTLWDREFVATALEQGLDSLWFRMWTVLEQSERSESVARGIDETATRALLHFASVHPAYRPAGQEFRTFLLKCLRNSEHQVRRWALEQLWKLPDPTKLMPRIWYGILAYETDLTDTFFLVCEGSLQFYVQTGDHTAWVRGVTATLKTKDQEIGLRWLLRETGPEKATVIREFALAELAKATGDMDAETEKTLVGIIESTTETDRTRKLAIAALGRDGNHVLDSVKQDLSSHPAASFVFGSGLAQARRVLNFGLCADALTREVSE